jgi:glycerophosphoryl diester phosphodiesterase
MEVRSETMDSRRSSPLVIARGGAADVAPASTIAAFESALDVGADALWLGIQLSKDGHPVVFGAPVLDRITDGRGRVGALTVRELKRLDAGGWKAPRFRGQRIQTLQEVLERFRDRTRFWLDLTANATEALPAIEERVISTLEIYDAVGVSVVAATGRESLTRLRTWSAEARLAAVWTRGAFEESMPDGGVAHALCTDSRLVTEDALSRIRAAGLDCHVQIDDEPALADRLIVYGVDGIITGRPEPLLARMGRR